MASSQLSFLLALARAQAGITRRLDNSLGTLHGLSFSDFLVLFHLKNAPGGRLRRVDLADRLGLTASGVTRILIPLEKIGLVTRKSDARDARVGYAALTRAGQRLFADSLATAEQISEELVSLEQVQQAGALAGLFKGLDPRSAAGP